MEIGKPKRVHRVEPLKLPLPDREPAGQPPAPAAPEKVPAG